MRCSAFSGVFLPLQIFPSSALSRWNTCLQDFISVINLRFYISCSFDHVIHQAKNSPKHRRHILLPFLWFIGNRKIKTKTVSSFKLNCLLHCCRNVFVHFWRLLRIISTRIPELKEFITILRSFDLSNSVYSGLSLIM